MAEEYNRLKDLKRVSVRSLPFQLTWGWAGAMHLGVGWVGVGGGGGGENRHPLPVAPAAEAGPVLALQSPDYQTKKLETKTLRNKLFHIKRMVSDYDKVRG